MDINDVIRAKVEALPTGPGVYRWKDKNGKVIYVGKAVNLKNRVRSYIRDDKGRSPKVAAMMRRAEDLDITMTATEMEALILECNLIKELHPKYNISLRDDKMYPYVKLSVREAWPGLSVTRNIKHGDGSRYFGPFTDVGGLRKTLRLLRRYYPIRTCRNIHVPRPCLQYHLQLCCAPCGALCTKEEYSGYVRSVCDIFDGKSGSLLKELQRKMEEASALLHFEKAAEYRDQISAVQSVRQRQHIVSKEGDFDVIGMARSEGYTGIEIFYIRYGKLVGKENFGMTESADEGDEEIISAFIKNFYGMRETGVPKEVIVPVLPEDGDILKGWLSSLRGSEVALHVPGRGFKRRLRDMAATNAEKYLSDKKLQWEYRSAREEGAVEKLRELLGLETLPNRMECFDISHHQGAETTGGMSVFEYGRPAKKEYRKFKLRTTQGHSDDFKSMAEVMRRRYGTETDWPLPDLIVLDGGLGQLHAALPVIRECGVTAPVIGLAKRMEEIYTEYSDEPLLIDTGEPALQLLQYIRDEAHRFVIGYHRQWTIKRNRESVLDHIPGVGPTRRNALWHAFRSLDEMKKATKEELSRVKGIDRRTAQHIYDFFRLRADEKQMLIEGTGTVSETESR